MTSLKKLAETRTMVLIDSQTLLQYLHDDREETFAEGVREGRYQAELAAKALGLSEGTIDNLRRRGFIESYEYAGQVRIERSEIERFKRNHKNIYKRMYNCNHPDK